VTTKTLPHRRTASPRRSRAAARALQQRRRRRRDLALWAAALAGLVAVIAVMMVTSRTTSDTEARPAPPFTLADTAGNQVSLADFRGEPVVLYFNEGAGCQSCFYQMADIEQHADEFDAAGVTVLPIVVNGAEETLRDMAAAGVRTPYLLDADKSVSRAYGTLDKGMHPGLPGHSFVLIDAEGVQRWYGEYPSMYLSSADLLDEIRGHLA
jgi:peroxiredoxin